MNNNSPLSTAPAVPSIRRALCSPPHLALLAVAFLLLGTVVPSASYVGGAVALVAAVRLAIPLGSMGLSLFSAIIVIGGMLHPVLQVFATLFALFALVRLCHLVVVASIRQVAAAVMRLLVTTRQMIKILLLLSALAMRKRRITHYVFSVVLLSYIYPFLVYFILYGMEVLANFGLSCGAAIGEWMLSESNQKTPLVVDPVILLHIGINALGFLLGYVVPGVVLLMAASAALASVALAKKRMQSEHALVAMFFELLLIYAVLIHYLNIVFPETYHYKNIGWPGQDLAGWVGNPVLYLASAADSLFVSAATLTLLGISAIELNSYLAKFLYVGQALHGLYILALGIRRIRDDTQ